MIILFKNRDGIIKFGDYAVAPTELTYNSVAEIPNNSYASLTAEQLERYNINSNDISYIFTGIVPVKSLGQLKSEKLSELETNYKNKIDLGYFDSVLNVTLRCDDYALGKFHRLSTQADGTSKNNLPYWDINDIKQTGTKQAVKSLLNRLGDYALDLEESLNDKKTLIAIAENETTLNDINLEF